VTRPDELPCCGGEFSLHTTTCPNASLPMPRTHYLKTWPDAFAAVRDRRKSAELRRNDRAFKVGEILCLMEWIPAPGYRGEIIPSIGAYTGRTVSRQIAHVLEGRPEFGLEEGFVLLSFEIGLRVPRGATRPDERVAGFLEPHPADSWPDNPDVVRRGEPPTR